MGLFAWARHTLGVVFGNLPLAIRPFITGWQGDRVPVSKLQRRYILFLVLMNLLIPVALAVGLVLASYQIGQQFNATLAAMGSVGAGAGEQTAKSSAVPLVAGTLISLTAMITLFQLIWKNFASPKLVELVSMFARDPVRMLAYFFGPPADNPLRRRTVRRLDKVYRLAREQYPDAKIHVIAYSFGSIAAYDWLFPEADGGRNGAKREIGAFVLLGLPYEMVAIFWPDYFDRNRDFEWTRLRRLHTVSLLNDVVGSPVRPGAEIRNLAAQQDAGLEIVEYNAEELPADWTDRLSSNPTGRGIELHGLYFGMADKLDSPAFRHCADSIAAVSRP